MVTYAMAFIDALSSLANAAIVWLNLRSSPDETFKVCDMLASQLCWRKQMQVWCYQVFRVTNASVISKRSGKKSLHQRMMEFKDLTSRDEKFLMYARAQRQGFAMLSYTCDDPSCFLCRFDWVSRMSGIFVQLQEKFGALVVLHIAHTSIILLYDIVKLKFIPLGGDRIREWISQYSKHPRHIIP